MTTQADRLTRAREAAGYERAIDAINRFRWVRNTYYQHENGHRPLTLKAAKQYGRAFRVNPYWLLDGSGDMLERQTIPVVGYIGAGHEVFPVDDNLMGDGMDQAEAPPDCSESTVAVIVRGDSMRPAYYDGDVIYYDTHVDPLEIIGREAVVKLDDGRVFVKTVERGDSPGVWSLHSHNAAPIRNVRPEWCARIEWVKRR